MTTRAPSTTKRRSPRTTPRPRSTCSPTTPTPTAARSRSRAVTQPTHGEVQITDGGAKLTYTPDANYCNSPSDPTDDFTYSVSPGGSTATVAVRVTCADDNPSAVNDQETVAEDDPATEIDVLANDTDPDGGPKSISRGHPAHPRRGPDHRRRREADLHARRQLLQLPQRPDRRLHLQREPRRLHRHRRGQGDLRR